MPNIDIINGIKINFYNGEHLPPHLHAIYGDEEVLLVIWTGEIYEGWLPVRQIRKARQCLQENNFRSSPGI